VINMFCNNMIEAKNSIKINRRIILVILIIAVLIGIFRAIMPYIPLYLNSLGMSLIDATRLTSRIVYIEYGLELIAIFIVSYFLGKNLDVKAELGTTIVSVYLGCFLGVFLGYGIGFSSMMNLTHESIPYLDIGGTILSMIGIALFMSVSLFFVSFSAIAIRYLRKDRAKPQIS
jgi:hypothetical protein